MFAAVYPSDSFVGAGHVCACKGAVENISSQSSLSGVEGSKRPAEEEMTSGEELKKKQR